MYKKKEKRRKPFFLELKKIEKHLLFTVYALTIINDYNENACMPDAFDEPSRCQGVSF